MKTWKNTQGVSNFTRKARISLESLSFTVMYRTTEVYLPVLPAACCFKHYSPPKKVLHSPLNIKLSIPSSIQNGSRVCIQKNKQEV